MEQGKLSEALKAYQIALTIRDRLAEAEPDNVNWQRDLAVSHSKLAVVLAEQGRALEALDALREGRAITVRLKERSPDIAQLIDDLAVLDAEIAKLEERNAAAAPAQPEQAAP